MKTSSILENLEFNDSKPAIKLLLESDFSKEIRISFKEGQIMQEHQTPYPIVVQVFKGEIKFGVNNQIVLLKEGDLITLEGGVPHDLTAVKESIVRLTLSKSDSLQRVKNI
ncbi:hypothetical protein UJ101_00224 [Flavobacteriaceae bacterium UJ101]|nr:hypothetical protein UJ101_00224 [Flavobacteriaceae bacterium UJ101]